MMVAKLLTLMINPLEMNKYQYDHLFMNSSDAFFSRSCEPLDARSDIDRRICQGFNAQYEYDQKKSITCCNPFAPDNTPVCG